MDGTRSSSSTNTANSLSLEPSMLRSLMLADPGTQEKSPLQAFAVCRFAGVATVQHRATVRMKVLWCFQSLSKVSAQAWMIQVKAETVACVWMSSRRRWLTNDIAAIISNEGFAVNINQLSDQRPGELGMSSQATQCDVLRPLVLH